MGARTALLLASVLWAAGPAAVGAQGLPSEPIRLHDGLVTLSSDVAASVGRDDPHFFNYTDYEHSALRTFRIDLTTAVRAGSHLSVLGEVRSENGDALDVYGLYLRVRPWAARAFDIQIGRVPPTFGAFGRRTYASDNPLIGYPLAYQYLTSLRPDALPASVDELLQMRGRGWQTSYTVGSATARPGVPLISGFRWDTGVQVHAVAGPFEMTGAVTAGTPSNPVLPDDNGGKAFASRVAWKAATGLLIGGSAARGEFVSSAAAKSARTAGADTDGGLAQTAWGVDAEYSRGRYVVRAEAMVSRWTIPFVRSPEAGPLTATAASVEGRYKLHPALYVAARVDHLGFSTVEGSAGAEAWDAPVDRIEVGAGYSLTRNFIMKFSFQLDRRYAHSRTTDYLPAAQVVYWF